MNDDYYSDLIYDTIIKNYRIKFDEWITKHYFEVYPEEVNDRSFGGRDERVLLKPKDPTL